MAFVTGNTSFSASNYRLDVDVRLRNVLQGQGFQYLMFLGVTDVQVAVRRGNAEIIFISHLSCAENMNLKVTPILLIYQSSLKRFLIYYDRYKRSKEDLLLIIATINYYTE